MSKRHHYIPKYYLKGFTASRNKLWVYPKDGSEPFRASISNVGLESHFYSVIDENGVRDSNTIEKFLAEKVEQPANSVIKKLRCKAQITKEEKYQLAAYLIGMFSRVPRHRERVRRDVPRLVQQAREIGREELHELASDSPEDQQRLKRLLKETAQILVRVEESLIEELSLPLFDEKMITTVYSMHWTLFTSHNKLSFLTGDNPFCYTESEGLLSDSSIFIFPVSSNIILLGSRTSPGYQDSMSYNPLSRDANDVVNKVVIRLSTKYIYHCTKAKWVSDTIDQVTSSSE